MSKLTRFIALAACCVLLFTFMVSCGETEIEKVEEYLRNNKPTPEDPYVTLNMYIPCNFDVTNDPVAKDTITAMQNEFNQVTEAKYRTRVIFKFIEEANYEAALAAQRDFAMQNQKTDLVYEQTSVQDKYPKEDSRGFQFDIFVATSERMVNEFVSANAILTTSKYIAGIYSEDHEGFNLTNALNNSYYLKFCKENNPTSMAPVIYANAKNNDVRYGVPANFLIGNYTYYAVNRALADELFFEQTTGTVAARIENLKNNIAAANNELALQGEAARYVEGDIIKDDVIDLTPYPAEDYYHLVKTNPQLSDTDIYNGMFCIASTCRYPENALKVISELYNNIDLHSTLQYGAKEITYTLKKVGDKTVVEPIADRPAYSINPRYTGNIGMLYECSDAALSGGIALTREYLDRVFMQNKDAVYVSN